MAAGAKQIIGILVFVLLFGGAIAALIYNISIGKKVNQQVTALFEPYFRLIDEGKLGDAYRGATTPHYQEQYSLSAFEKAWGERISRFGKMTRREYRGANRTHRIGRSSGYTVVWNFWFEKNELATANYFVADQPDGTLRIDMSSRVSGTQRPVPEPW